MTDTILWDKCLNAFNSVLSEKQMRTWFHPLEVIRKDKTLNVVAPNKFVKLESLLWVPSEKGLARAYASFRRVGST